MSQLADTSRGSRYSDDDRVRACTEYSILGSFARVSATTGIPKSTVCSWDKQQWWQSLLAQLRIENKSLIRAKVQSIIESGFDAIQDRITVGDSYVKKDGELGRKPASLRDLGVVTGIAFDKLRLIDNEPTSISSGSSSEALKALQDQFAKLATNNVIEGETINKSPLEGETSK